MTGTTVLFRVDKEGIVYALFPNEKYDEAGRLCMTYQHVGQHSGADYRGCISTSRSATPKEFGPLAEELRSIGYSLVIRKRWNRPRAS